MRRMVRRANSKILSSLLLVWIVASFLLRGLSIFIPGVYVASVLSSALFLMVWALVLLLMIEMTPLVVELWGGCTGFIFGGIYLYLISLIVPGVALSGIFVSIILSIVLNIAIGIVF